MISLTHFSTSGRLRQFLMTGSLLTCLITWIPTVQAALINEWEPLDLEGNTKKTTWMVKTGQPWRDPTSDVALLWIEGGCFQMGSPPRADGRETDEGPVHEACVNGFWLGETEVTQGQWRRVMHNNPSRFRKGDHYPVENVSREEVNEFIATLNSKMRLNVRFRLPTEAEWEFACREGGQRIVYPGGSDPGRMAWYGSNSHATSHPVGQRTANRLGLKDMSGNVWEWVQTPYHPGYNAPPSGSTNYDTFYTIRGGGWPDDPTALRCANRGFQSLASRRPDLGLRLAASPIIKEKKTKVRHTDRKPLPF
ncbi:MAG: formylglycine-generating enzyme family protein [Magnetococcales bacterium]|nr:formylglycine-generating enzyme family protein [Magnetococcales bacterium]